MLDDRTAPMENPQPDRRPIEEIIREVMDDPREAPPTPIPAEETPVEEAPVEEAPAEESPTEEAPVEEAPAAEAPTEEAAPEETPAEEAAEEPSPAPAENQKKKLPKGWLIALLVLAVLAAGIAALCVAAGSGDTVYAGVSVLGVDMGGMTPREAQAAWTDRSPAAYRAHSVAITVDEQPVASPSLAELGVSLTAEEAAQAALRACRSGNFLRDGYYLAYSWFAPREVLPAAFRVDRDALEAAVDAAIDGLDFTVIDGAFSLEKEGPEGPGLYITCPRDGKLIDEEKLLADLAEKLAAGDFTPVACGYTEKTAAGIDVQQYYTENRGKAVGAIYDRETGKPTRSHVGLEMDAAAVEAQLAAAAPGETFLAEAQVEFPKVSTEELETCMFRDVLGTVTTKVSGSSSRIGNVKLSAKCIDGRVYNPGEEFWYNKTVGRRTVERGFGQAPAYFAGKTVMEVGGGICQTSSTLYYAALLADLRIVLRYAHQYVPGYIKWGCDATVSWGGPDFAFANSTDYPIKIVMGWDNNELTMTILGTKTDDHYVEMENYVRGKTSWSDVVVYNPDRGPEEMVEVQTPYTGYTVDTYRCRYDGQGNLLSRTFEAKSRYDMRNRIYETGDPAYAPME